MNQHVRDNLLALQDRIQAKRKPTGVNINNSVTLTNDADLKFTAVAGQNYIFQFDVLAGTTSTGIDLQVAFSFPAGNLNFDAIGLDVAAAFVTASVNLSGIQTATSGATPIAVGLINGTTHVTVQGAFQCTTGGTVNLMLAQNTLTATNVLICAGSSMIAIREAA